MSFIELENVSLEFNAKKQKIKIFRDLNMSIEKGEFVTIIGPSGKGKTTLLNIISGFLRPNSGNVYVDNENICFLSEDEICKFRNRRIGYIFQQFNLIQQFNVFDNISVPLLLNGIKKKDVHERVDGLLEIIGLSNRRMEYPYTLSGGEQQRVAFARAIANNPDVILADEPTGNLDSVNGRKIISLLKDVNIKNNVTVLCVTHDNRIIDDNDGHVINIETITQQD